MNVKGWLIFLGALGLALRIALALSISPVLLYDSLEYHQYANNLALKHQYYADIFSTPQAKKAGRFYSTRAPGYVFFLAGIYKLFGPNPKVVSLFQALLDFFNGILVFLIARNWLSSRHSLWAFLGYQIFVVQVPMLMSEIFFLFWLLLSLWILCGKRSFSWHGALVNGVSWGVMILTKPETIIFVLVFAGYWVWQYSWKRALIALLIMFGVISPWLWREKQVHRRFVWITTRGGMTFFDGNYLPIEKREVFLLAEKLNLEEAELDRLFYRLTWDYLKKHPGHYFQACFKRLRVLFDLETYNGINRFFLMPLLEPGGVFRTGLAFIGYYLFLLSRLIMVLGLVGALLSWKRFSQLFLIYALPIVIIIFHFTLFLGKPRYLVPAYPSFCIFFGLLIAQIWGDGIKNLLNSSSAGTGALSSKSREEDTG